MPALAFSMEKDAYLGTQIFYFSCVLWFLYAVFCADSENVLKNVI